jgi:hypothetical protein
MGNHELPLLARDAGTNRRLRPLNEWLQSQSMLQPTVSHDQILITVRQFWVSWCGALSQTRGRSSPAQSFLGANPTGLVTIFYCLTFETPRTWRARSPHLYPQGTSWSSYTPRHCVTDFLLLYCVKTHLCDQVIFKSVKPKYLLQKVNAYRAYLQFNLGKILAR